MGLFSFVKEIGHKLGIGTASAEELKKGAVDSGLAAAGNLDVKVEGGKAIVSGPVKTQEEAERIILALGNTAGIESVETNLAVELTAPESVMYTVKKGDTLWKIAEMHYGKGHGAKYTDIVKANSPPVKNPDLIQPGWVLRLPK
ncbi:peptidoglycan-binding protein LysM [Candidatus Raskinella chloraquaticus]|jgi:nucleoid-associated protein YgaU|uniref:Peptidoglycan-binding protein LysM n=1 Tax=Candidatus Raskinella chloraquaticus TaxID=1951219 RepID=A0A1W9HVN4_9HYPH|nr:MAG: peptidoglycan-binding protein LysM [Proteobacteria bacterium SG_bin8]